MKIIILAIINSLLMATGQILWKLGVSNTIIESLNDLAQLIISPFVLLGLFVYGVTTLLWLYILNQAPLSYVYPIQSLAFVFILFASFFIFHESIPYTRWIGVFVICIGVYIVSMR